MKYLKYFCHSPFSDFHEQLTIPWVKMNQISTQKVFFSKKHCHVSSSCLSVQNVFDYYLQLTQHSVIIYPIVSILHIMNTSVEQKKYVFFRRKTSWYYGIHSQTVFQRMSIRCHQWVVTMYQQFHVGGGPTCSSWQPS